MHRRALLLFCLSWLVFASSLHGRKKTSSPSAAPRMTADQKALHALNRLAFGARPGEVEAVKREGVDRWIQTQLHPEAIAESPVLEARLAPLDSLRMSTAELARNYPTQPTVKAMMAGRLPLPSDPLALAAVKTAIARETRKKTSDGVEDAQQNTTEDRPRSGNGMAATGLTGGPEFTGEQRATLMNGRIEDRLALLQTLPPEQLALALETLPAGMRARLAREASPELRRKIQRLTTPLQMAQRDLTEGKLLRAIYSNRQLEDVLTDFWYNHFNVFLDKGADRSLVTAYERDAIRPHVLGKFKDLLLATAQSPAMLFYLDNWQSTGADSPASHNRKRLQGLNENYGRELMELHTLGVDGGYTQQDVTEVARCFTGWTLQRPPRGGEFQFDSKMHDAGEKHVLGVTIAAGGGMSDGLRVLDLLARHPATARFLSKSLAIRFVADDPPESLITRMAAAFAATDGDLREVMRTMLASPEFWDPAVFRAKLKSPLEMVVSAIRAVNGDVQPATALAGVMNQLGEPLYRKQEPTGYSNRGSDWLNSASLLARINFANALAQAKIPGVLVDTARFSGDAREIERGLLFAEPSPEALAAIEAGSGDQQDISPGRRGSLIAGLTLGSPDFQRR